MMWNRYGKYYILFYSNLIIFFCRTDVLKLLIKSGADKTVKNNFDQTAFEAVIIDFSAVKPVYVMMGKMLGPMGINVDLDYLEKTRPLIAELLK